ncbi:Hvo_1808 family surface protein [Natrialbaceae archaeon A-arb3/5]
MNSTRAKVVAVCVLFAVVLLAAMAGGGFSGVFSEGASPTNNDTSSSEDRPASPSTAETPGYVEGYWYDDELSVDDRDDAALEPDELDEVVYRSMARVEKIRNLTFEDEVDVDVVSREEYQAESDDQFANASGVEQLQQNVNYEALFMVDRETDAEDEFDALYGGNVAGYYEPATESVVVVSDNPETPETDEVILGHELLHALQDQHFDLSSYDRDTIDQDTAVNGLIEGDAVWVEREYEQRCETEWECVLPADEPPPAPDLNWGLYLTIFQPYSDGPDYVDALLERDDGWAAVDAAYDEPPTSSSDVIRPDESHETANVTVSDRSNDDWDQLAVDGEVATETVGEAGIVSMLAAGAFDPTEPTVIERGDLLADGGYEYDHRYTDGWVGDELVTYVDEDTEPADTESAIDRTGYVWQTEWDTSEDAEQFLDGYTQLLEGYGAAPVEDRQNTYEIDDGYPGAYAIGHDGERVTIVRGPSVDDLDSIEAGVAAEGEDTIALGGDESGSDAVADDDGSAVADPVTAGSLTAAALVVFGTSVVILVVRRRTTARRVESVVLVADARADTAVAAPKSATDG